MKRLFFLMVLGLCTMVLGAQNENRGLYSVAFYNLENLFDTIHDAGKNDYDFLPGGSYKWTSKKYEAKLANLARVLSSLSRDRVPQGPAFIGVAEVENSRVLDDLLKQPSLSAYKYVHYEGPDRRGIDCALLYNPRFFIPEKSFLQPYIYEEKDSAQRTRGFLTVQGKLADDDVTFIVCHWPSRAAVSYYRERAGEQVRALTDSIRKASPDMKIIVMGDMNDDPFSPSMAKALGAKRKMEDVDKGDFYNPWWDVLVRKGQGTLMYDGKWNLFDQIVLSPGLLNRDGKKDYSSLKYFKNEIKQ